MTQLLFILISIFTAFFGAKAAAGKTVTCFKKSGVNMQTACWAVSRLLGCIIISGIIIALFVHSSDAPFIFCAAILAVCLGHTIGAVNAKENKEK